MSDSREFNQNWYTIKSGEMELQTEEGTEQAKVVVVMPAYNAAKTLKISYEDIPPSIR